jgi:uncharacterized RDD family membrane protein YckC
MDRSIAPEAASQAAGSPSAVAEFRPLRTWPAIVLLAALWASKLIPPLFEDLGAGVLMLSFSLPLLWALLLGVWWLAASRAKWWERLLGLAGVGAAAPAREAERAPSGADLDPP